MVAQQEEQVDDRFKRIVDLMGDDASNTSHGGKFFGFTQRLLGLQPGRDVAVYLQNRVARSIEGHSAGDDDFGSKLGAMNQVSLPRSHLQQRSRDVLVCNR